MGLPGYDAWLYKQADEYLNRTTCEGPEVIDSYKEYAGRNEDGSIDYYTEYVYNCEECDETDCEHWKEWHSEEWEELQKEKELENGTDEES